MEKPRKKSLREVLIGKVAERMVVEISEPPAIALKKKELKDSRVAFITTAGVHLKSDEPFDIRGDHTFRIIPGSARREDLTITHDHYDISEAMKDINVVFPLGILKDLAEEGRIGEVAPRHFGFMGYIPESDRLIKETAPLVADMLVEDGVDIALLSPG